MNDNHMDGSDDDSSLSIDRRLFLGAGLALGAAVALGAAAPASASAFAEAAPKPRMPGPAAWAQLRRQVGGRLVQPTSPLSTCYTDAGSAACESALSAVTNPFYNESLPGGTQITGYLNGWRYAVSPYAVAARNASDIAAAVNFARQRRVRLVVKGTGHDFLGRSSAPNSLLVWTHNMRKIVIHDSFRPLGAPSSVHATPAMTYGAGTRWLEAYQAATKHGLVVQGGTATSVGAAGGFIQGGGYGTWSRMYGSAAGNMLEAKVITANGQILTVNEYRYPDLFWALRGGGGGTFAIVANMTVRAFPIARTTGSITGSLTASSDQAFKVLLEKFAQFCGSELCNAHWGETVTLTTQNSIVLGLYFLDLSEARAQSIWRPFLDWVQRTPGLATENISFVVRPFSTTWDGRWYQQNEPGSVLYSDVPGETNLWWYANPQAAISLYMDSMQSRWLPASLFTPKSSRRLANALFKATRSHNINLSIYKGLHGANPGAIARSRRTSINPVVFDAAVLAQWAGSQQNAFPGIPGHEPDRAVGRQQAQLIDEAWKPIRAISPKSGSYVNETNFFEPDWKNAFWGTNYHKLLRIKHKYDPDNLFQVHHGVGSSR